MTGKYRTGVAVVVVLSVVEGEGEQGTWRGFAAQGAHMLSIERTAIEVLRKITQIRVELFLLAQSN